MKILIADKNASVRALVSMRLQARAYEVIESDTSEEVLRILERGKIDLVLLSSEMERIGGRLLIEKIRQKANLTTLPIILLAEEGQISELVLTQERGFDDFITKPFNPLVLQLRVALTIFRAQQRMEANALTHLPGNFAIERVIRGKIESRQKFSVIYIDINHFKSFNDKYGFEKGDDVIRQTAKILLQTAAETTKEGECFVGHIGGDDFIAVTPVDKEEIFARKFLFEFDRIIPTYYNEKDQERRGIRTKNRQGKLATFPLMSCSAAACNNSYRDYKSLSEISADAAELKAFLKMQTGSQYLRDRRSSPMKAAEEVMEMLSPQLEEKKAAETADPFGQILVGAGLITAEQLSLALKKHFETGQRLGQVLISMNLARSEDVGRLLEKKLNVPYVSLKTARPTRDVMRLFTMEFIRSHRVVPLEIRGEWLQLGMCDPFDIRTIDAIERITGHKPMPHLALEDEFEYFLEQWAQDPFRDEKARKAL